MAACTPGSWTKTGVVNGYLVYECDVVGSTSNDYYTKVIDFIDPNKPFSVVINSAAANTAAATPVDLWGGWTAVGLSGDAGTVAWATAGKGMELQGAIADDVQSVAKQFLFNPAYTGTAVQAAAGVIGHRVPPRIPYFCINCDAGGTSSVTVHFVVSQAI